jgi:hypothetical protein
MVKKLWNCWHTLHLYDKLLTDENNTYFFIINRATL